MTSVIAVCYRCSQCGKDTDWEEALGPKPLCAKCWDEETASSFEAELTGKEFSRRYQLAYRGELQEDEREASLTNQAEAKEERESIYLNTFLDITLHRLYNQVNYQRHKPERKIRRSRNYRSHATQEIEYSRNYRLTHKAQVKASNQRYNSLHREEALKHERSRRLARLLLTSGEALNIRKSPQYYVNSQRQIDFTAELNVT